MTASPASLIPAGRLAIVVTAPAPTATPERRELAPDEAGMAAALSLAREWRQAGHDVTVTIEEAMTPSGPHDTAQTGFTIAFDGGKRGALGGRPAEAYGSFAIAPRGVSLTAVPPTRLMFRPELTSNEAEYAALEAALQALLDRLTAEQRAPELITVEIRGDSKLVVEQVAGLWSIHAPHLVARRDVVQALMQRFGSCCLRHWPRQHSVTVFGH